MSSARRVMMSSFPAHFRILDMLQGRKAGEPRGWELAGQEGM